MVTPTVAQVGDAYLVASGILTPDEEGFNAVDESHNPERGAHRVLAFAQDMLRVSRLVRWVPTRLLPAPHHLHHARLAGLRRTVHVCVCVCVFVRPIAACGLLKSCCCAHVCSKQGRCAPHLLCPGPFCPCPPNQRSGVPATLQASRSHDGVTRLTPFAHAPMCAHAAAAVCAAARLSATRAWVLVPHARR